MIETLMIEIRECVTRGVTQTIYTLVIKSIIKHNIFQTLALNFSISNMTRVL
jgi:hypothetical protein